MNDDVSRALDTAAVLSTLHGKELREAHDLIKSVITILAAENERMRDTISEFIAGEDDPAKYQGEVARLTAELERSSR